MSLLEGTFVVWQFPDLAKYTYAPYRNLCAGCAVVGKFRFDVYTTLQIMPKPNATVFILRPLVRNWRAEQTLKLVDKVMCMLQIATEGM